MIFDWFFPIRANKFLKLGAILFTSWLTFSTFLQVCLTYSCLISNPISGTGSPSV